MPPTTEFPFRNVFFSPSALTVLPKPIRSAALDASEGAGPETTPDRSLVVSSASEVLRDVGSVVPGWVDAETRYLIFADVPEPALFRIPTVLRVHKPDHRIHVTRDPGAIKRQAIALVRDYPLEGVVDAYLLWRDLWVVLGDMSTRCFPIREVDALARMPDRDLSDYSIHPSGSFILWHRDDLRLGPSQLLQAVDPMYLADVLIDRYAREKVSSALRILRERRSLNQSDVTGLSSRHVRRLEKEELRLTSDAAASYAAAMGITLQTFLEELSKVVTELQPAAGSASPDESAEERVS